LHYGGKSIKANETIADVCLILEGSYPYVQGGVSSWVHLLIQSMPQYTFHLWCLCAPRANLLAKYELPKNVVGRTNTKLQRLPAGKKLTAKEKKTLFSRLEGDLLNLLTSPRLEYLEAIIQHLRAMRKPLDENVLLNSPEAFRMVSHMYFASLANTSFLDYFWSLRALVGGLFSVLMADLPLARSYHACSTGYAGLALARASIEAKRACLLTEHGIYTSERRIEILLADWIKSGESMRFSLKEDEFERSLQDLWIDSFKSYAKLAYDCSDKIVTLFEGNRRAEILEGAPKEKIQIIVNGVELDKYKKIKKVEKDFFCVALIGRVVPIKDLRTYIKSIELLRHRISSLKAYIIGPVDEDAEYYNECVQYVAQLDLADILEFSGKVNVLNYYPKIDVVVLSSLSEAQPLSLLEAGAAGIPVVATRVGACEEIVYGSLNEKPNLGQAGIICPLANPKAIADAVYKFFVDTDFYQQCSRTSKQRTHQYYSLVAQNQAYSKIYEELIHK